MKIVVIRVFRDKFNPAKVFSPGMIVSDFEDSRAKDLVLRGLAAIAEEQESGKPNQGTSGGTGGLHGSMDTGNSGNTMDTGDAGDKAPGIPATDIDLTQQHLKVIASVKHFTDVEKLKGYLAEENASAKPRTSVADAIAERIEELEKG
ncbi:MAG: hypothetical protein LBB90_10420 [Tannerella sp.]|jgi:hypothetical protein|nr:hypothetical protein [Tannerella sp.]